MPSMPQVVHPKTGKPLVTAAEAAAIYGCTPTQIARLARAGQLQRFPRSDRQNYYDPDEVRRRARENAEVLRERGGRPRKDPLATAAAR